MRQRRRPDAPPDDTPTQPPPGDTPADDAHGGRARFHYRRSLASRVTVLTTMAVLLTVVLLALGAYLTARVQLQQQLDESLLNRAKLVSTYDVLETLKLPEVSAGAADVRVAVMQITGDGVLLRASAGDPDTESLKVGRPEIQVAAGDAEESVRTIRGAPGAFRVVAVPVPDEPDTAVVLAQSLEEQSRVLSKLGLVMGVLGLLGVMVAAVAGWAVTTNGLRPVRRLTARVEEVARTEDLRPMPVEGRDEVARLAGAFNQLVTSLGASRERQKRLVADAGHELRTPITSLRTNVDLLTQADDAGLEIDPRARRELLDDIGAQTIELTTLIGDLTELARDEPMAPVVGLVDLGEVVDQSVARVRRRAPSVTFDVRTDPWDVTGEAPALERAVTNLLDNAAKWSPTDGVVRVVLAGGTLIIDDQGPGIAPADRQRVFDRFWRASDARTLPGSGLGLSIVSRIVERHAGTVEALEAPGGGARLVMRLPGTPRHAVDPT